MVQKRSLFILCAVLVLALLVGCSRKSAETVEPTPTAVATLAAAATTSVDAQAENAATEAPQEQATVDPTEAPQEQETIETTNPVQSVTAITEVFGDGQKITAVALEYDADIDNSLLSESAFSVEDRTITDVYANTSPELATQGINGKYVIIQLSADDEAASVGGNNMGGGNGPGMGNDTGTPPDAESEGTETITDTQTMVSEQMPEVQPATSDTTAEITVTVTQTGMLSPSTG